MTIQQYYTLLNDLKPSESLSDLKQLNWLKAEKAKLLAHLSLSDRETVLINDKNWEKKVRSSTV